MEVFSVSIWTPLVQLFYGLVKLWLMLYMYCILKYRIAFKLAAVVVDYTFFIIQQMTLWVRVIW